MKRATMMQVLWLPAVLLLLGLTGSVASPRGSGDDETFTHPQIRCETRERKPCKEADVRTLNEARRSYDGKRKEAVEHIRAVTLLDRQGVLKCERLDGKPCTAAQRLGLMEVANQQGLNIVVDGAPKPGTDGWTTRQ
jgi:hypothetical protein